METARLEVSMAREGLGGHLTGTLPLSIAAHLAALVLMLIIPLAADVSFPDPATEMPGYVQLVAPPPPAFVPAATAHASSAPPRERSLAPVTPPSPIEPEQAQRVAVLDLPPGPP